MALAQRLQLRQAQTLVMTPQLLQAIKLLQLSNMDLAAYVETEIERNPLLAQENDGEAASDDGDEELEHAGGAENGDAAAADWLPDRLDISRAAIEARLDADLGNVFPDDAAPRPGATSADASDYSQWADVGPGGREDGDYNLEAFVSAEPTLAGHLREQLLLAVHDPAERLIGQYLIDLVDDAGYLAGDVADVAEKLGASIDQVDAVLAVLQTFDPAGVCARNLSECLAIQLKERDRFDPAMQALVARLDLLAKHDLVALRGVCGVEEDDLADMIAEIRRLNPKPGLAFGGAIVQPIVPDVFVRQGPAGGWLVELNSDTLPRVLVNHAYYAEVARNAKNAADKTYLSDCMQNATWLVRALDQRANTILKVATEIVRQQDAFLAEGVRRLRPLTLKTVADAIGMHESTVSRVTANKYMATSRGVYELKFFFTSAIAAADGGEAHSAEAVRDRIRGLIDAEPPHDVLSDEAIVDKLREAGVEIARRTVAKYREAMKIPSSTQRRRAKRRALAPQPH